MSDVTITEFLTARYDEDEAALTAYQEHRAGLTPCINYEGQHPDLYDDLDSCWRHAQTSRASRYSDVEFGVADIAAERRIVELARKDLADADASPDDVIRRAFNRGAAYHAHNVLLLLAMPYADHPDYEEWKP